MVCLITECRLKRGQSGITFEKWTAKALRRRARDITGAGYTVH